MLPDLLFGCLVHNYVPLHVSRKRHAKLLLTEQRHGGHPFQGDGRAGGWVFQVGSCEDIQGVSRQAIHTWAAQRKQSGAQGLRAKRARHGCGADGSRRGSKRCWPAHHRSLPRPVEAAVLPVDARSRGGVDLQKVWGARFGLDGGAGRLLARWGFTAQKPAWSAFEQNLAVQFDVGELCFE